MLPTFNESMNIADIIDLILEHNPSIEILVVDDQSPDGTADIVEELMTENSKIYLIKRLERGRGSAGRTGFKYAIEKGFEVVVEMDADFSHDPTDIPRLISKIPEYDVVIGSRYVSGGGTFGLSKFRKILSSLANLYIHILLNIKVRDCTGGFKAFKVNALNKLDFDSFITDKMLYDGPETLFRLSKLGFKMIELPIVFSPRRLGKSKLTFNKILRNIVNNLKLRVRIK